MEGQKAIESIMLEFKKLTRSERIELVNILMKYISKEIKKEI
tara:strand:+ start:6187 stop:6312 length:126 start_codon:yes stop_codon:yes gene_type:complete